MEENLHFGHVANSDRGTDGCLDGVAHEPGTQKHVAGPKSHLTLLESRW